MSIKTFLASKECEQFSFSFLLYTIALFLFSFITISVEQVVEDHIKILSFHTEELEIEQEPISIEEMKFDTNLTSLNKSMESSISIADTQDTPLPIQIEHLEVSNPVEKLLVNLIDTSVMTENVHIGIDSAVKTAQNIDGVIDRLTPEIVSLAERRPINVIWLFDASISLSNQRKNIKDRISKILNELDSMSLQSHRITHSICAFGQSLSVISKSPTNDANILYQDIDAIRLDTSGTENIFESILKLTDVYKKYRNTIIVFTDEIGDDIHNLEKCIQTLRRNVIPIYVVGSPAPFGSSTIEFKYVDPDPMFDQKEKWVHIQQGPETLFKMTLDLKILPIDNEGLDSGYGPYALTRLCYESGGIYFAMHPNRDKQILSKKDVAPLSSNITQFFDNEVMKRYRPDYRNIVSQQNDVNKDPVKLALVKACQIPLQITFNQQMSFTAFSEAEFVEQLKNAQNFAAKLEPKINEIYALLISGEPYIGRMKEDRWIASYYLALGRILATKCRVELYNHILANGKAGLKKKNPKTNAWDLEPDNTLNIDHSQLKKIYHKAKACLELVISKYPDTPWASIAQAELDTPMGYKWIEKYVEPVKDKMQMNLNNNIPKDDQMKKLEYKPQRKIDKI